MCRCISVFVVLSLATSLALAAGPAARAQEDDCSPTYQLWLVVWGRFLTDPMFPQPPMPNPADACYASASQGAQDALAAWNTNRILALVAIASAAPSPTPQGDAAPSPTPQADVTRTPAPPPASGTGQSVAPPALCTQAQFVVVPPAIRPGE